MERLSALAGISIGTTQAIAPNIRSRAVWGAKSPEDALRRMLTGTDLEVIRLDSRTYRIVARKRPPKPLPAPAPEPEEPIPDIVVVATKRPQWRDVLGGSIEVVSFESPLGGSDQRGDVVALSAQLPSLSSTGLGRGRDKLFLRGIADSSFTGKSEATLGEYLGEARINYNAPDPGLLLYDLRRVELLKGAQGTLYGGGTLSGVLRLEPERPDLFASGGFVDLSGSSTAHGDPSRAIAGMVNLPISTGRAGVRLLGYQRVDGGYIDDAGRGLENVNRSRIGGGRAQLRVDLGIWQLDLLGTHQRIASADSNYAIASLPPLQRKSVLAQPSENSFSLVDAELHGSLDGLDIVSTTSTSRNNIEATYDATSIAGAPTAFVDDRRLRAFNHETRVSRSARNGTGWIIGASIYAQREVTTQQAGPDLVNLDGNFNTRRLDVSGFAQGSARRGQFLFTAGLRGSFARVRAQTDLALANGPTANNDHLRASPMAEIAWAGGQANVALSYREGWRSGGASIVQFPGALPDVPPGLYLVPFYPDHVRVLALNAGYSTGGRTPFSLQATLSGADWDRIQSASLDQRGFVYTANADNADLLNLDLSAGWKPSPPLEVRAGASLTRAFTDSFFEDSSGLFGSVGTVPSVPDVAGYAAVNWRRTLGDAWELGVESRLSYRGRSRLGLSGRTDPTQGKVVNANSAARLKHGGYAAVLEVENLTDDRSSLFGYGNPFTVANERQSTPARPRTVSLSLHAAF
jgi:outer membrane receptor protein involved in Fe transport